MCTRVISFSYALQERERASALVSFACAVRVCRRVGCLCESECAGSFFTSRQTGPVIVIGLPAQQIAGREAGQQQSGERARKKQATRLPGGIGGYRAPPPQRIRW